MSYDLLSGNEAVHSGWISARNTIESFKGVEALMMRRMEEEASRIFLACGATDFRKQITSLVALVSMQFHQG